MLKHLHIENIAVIELVDIDFSSGFNVLTGETGAGKSILIDSINAVLGERTSKELIRAGCDNAVVCAVFGDLTTQNLGSLKAFDVFPDEDGNIVVYRKISRSGKNLIKINDIPSTVATLKDISQILINIHGQHDNQLLLNPDMHCSFIDAVAENSNLLKDYYSEFKRLNVIRKELQALEFNEDEKKRKIDLLNYEIEELEKADIKIGETENLKKKLSVAENFEKIISSLNKAINFITGDDDTDGALFLLRSALKNLQFIDDENFTQNTNKLQDAIEAIEDINSNLFDYLNSKDYSDYNLDNINQRLDLISRLMLKYGNSEEKLLEYLNNSKNELDSITYSEKRIFELSKQLEDSKQLLIEKAEKLTASRTRAGKFFEENVCDILKDLNMPDIKFKVSIIQSRYTKNGCDNLEFLISTNKGEDLKPLSKVASGGELSRIMLAIKSALLDKDTIETMIFDEIDSGISGFTADKVATQLVNVSKNHQVICITHLAQIAAKADNHLLISKISDNNRTYTKVKELSYDDRINEIARIMSGTEITQNLYNSAKELIDRG